MYGSRKLTPAEWKVVVLTAWGLKNREIGQQLKISQHVVKNKLRRIYDKLGVWNRLELALWYMKYLENQ